MTPIAHSRMRTALPIVALVSVSAVLRIAASRSLEAPWIAPDEMIYGLLGRSLWETGQGTLLGEPAPFYGGYPLLVGLPLHLLDVAEAVADDPGSSGDSDVARGSRGLGLGATARGQRLGARCRRADRVPPGTRLQRPADERGRVPADSDARALVDGAHDRPAVRMAAGRAARCARARGGGTAPGGDSRSDPRDCRPAHRVVRARPPGDRPPRPDLGSPRGAGTLMDRLSPRHRRGNHGCFRCL